MRQILAIITLWLLSLSLHAQQSVADMFTGTWKNQVGTEVFIVSIWKTADGYRGHYKKLVVDRYGNTVSCVYNSDRPVGNSNFNWPFAISGGFTSSNSIDGLISDNTVVDQQNNPVFIDRRFRFDVMNPECYSPKGNTCVVQAKWFISEISGLRSDKEPNLNLPKELLFTKLSN